MTRVPLALAAAIAGEARARLAPACERLEVAGSIRRGRPDVGDVELVAEAEGQAVGCVAARRQRSRADAARQVVHEPGVVAVPSARAWWSGCWRTRTCGSPTRPP